jgi:CheY-like chemotaxis protein
MERVIGFPAPFLFRADGMNSSQATVLLAEDESNDVFLMQRAFKKAQLMNPLQIARDGEEVIAYLGGNGRFASRKEFPLPQLLLLDLKLPRKTGFEVLEWIRRQTSPVKRLPVVVLSSSKQAVDINRAYDLGANSYLVKPVHFEGLVDFVKTLEMFWFGFSQKPEVQSTDVGNYCSV